MAAYGIPFGSTVQPEPRHRDPRPEEAPPAGLLTTDGVARLLHVHPKHVYRLLRRGLPRRRVGSEWRFDTHEVLEWSRGGVAAPSPSRAAPPLVAANGDPAVELLFQAAVDSTGPVVGSVAADSGQALGLLARNVVVAAGYHGREFPARLSSGRLVRLHLVTREVGLACPSRKGPPRIEHLEGARLASRPPSAGTRPLFELALRTAGADPDAVHRDAQICDSPRDVVCAVSRGEADVGVTSRAWAHRVGLPFAPVAVEAYGILLFAEDLGRPAVVRLCEVAQGAEFRRRLRGVPGYDADETGTLHYDDESAAVGPPG